MYFESREHQLKVVANAAEAAAQIKNGLSSHIVLTWRNQQNEEVFAVSDVHVDDKAFAETAILKKMDNKMYQVESITVGWCKQAEVVKYFQGSELITIAESMGERQLIIGEASEDVKGSFECGCCGTYFEDSIKRQKQFDQDTGFGICKKCEKYYL